jgi:hypothetical protein
VLGTVHSFYAEYQDFFKNWSKGETETKIFDMASGAGHGRAAGGRIQGHQVQPGDRVEEQFPQNQVKLFFFGFQFTSVVHLLGEKS